MTYKDESAVGKICIGCGEIIDFNDVIASDVVYIDEKRSCRWFAHLECLMDMYKKKTLQENIDVYVIATCLKP